MTTNRNRKDPPGVRVRELLTADHSARYEQRVAATCWLATTHTGDAVHVVEASANQQSSQS